MRRISNLYKKQPVYGLIIQKTILSLCKKQSSIMEKKLHVKFALKTSLSSHAICQLAREDHLNIQDNYIQTMLRKSEQLKAKAHFLEFKNKKLMKALKSKKKRQNRDKKLNLLDEKDDGTSYPRLYL